MYMYRRQNQSQQLQSHQPKTFTMSENPAYDQQQSVYDDITDLDQETYTVPDDGAWYDELKDVDIKDANETYDHPDDAPASPNPYEGLNVANTTYDQPDAGPALPDRPTLNPSQDLNQETAKPNTAPVYLELIGMDEDKNQTAECWSECCAQSTAGFQDLRKATIDIE